MASLLGIILIILGIFFVFFFIWAIVYSIGKKNFKEVLLSALNIALIAGVIGAVIGVLLSIFAIFSIGFTGLLATIVLGLCGFGILGVPFLLLMFTYYGLPEGVRKAIFYFICIPLLLAILFGICWLLYTAFTAGTLPEYLKFASPIFEGAESGFGELAKFRHCLYADPRCPFFISWEDASIQSAREELYVIVGFSEKKILSDNTVNLMVSLSVSNPELAELKIKPKCYLGKDKEKELTVKNMGTYSYGDEFIFPSTVSGQELHTSFRCVGDVPEAADKNLYSDNIIIELERPVAVKTIWPIWIGEQPRMGIVKSEMKFNAPYMVSLGSHNDMPFEEGKDYDFQLTIKRKEEDVKLKEIESILVSFPEDILAGCDNFEAIDHEFELGAYPYESLKALTQYEKEYDKFIFPCILYVISAPKQAVVAPMELEAYYTVYSDYKTLVTKSP